MNFSSCDIALTPEDLVVAEAQLGLQLPSTFKHHYLSYNGGRPAPARYIADGFDLEVVACIPLKSDRGRRTVLEDYRHLVQVHGLVPGSLVPFASIVGGDILFVDAATEGGEVYLWRHDTALENRRLRSLGVDLATFFASLEA